MTLSLQGLQKPRKPVHDCMYHVVRVYLEWNERVGMRAAMHSFLPVYLCVLVVDEVSQRVSESSSPYSQLYVFRGFVHFCTVQITSKRKWLLSFL